MNIEIFVMPTNKMTHFSLLSYDNSFPIYAIVKTSPQPFNISSAITSRLNTTSLPIDLASYDLQKIIENWVPNKLLSWDLIIRSGDTE